MAKECQWGKKGPQEGWDWERGHQSSDRNSLGEFDYYHLHCCHHFHLFPPRSRFDTLTHDNASVVQECGLSLQ